MAQGSAKDEAGERLGEMVVEWAEAYWEEQQQERDAPAAESREAC